MKLRDLVLGNLLLVCIGIAGVIAITWATVVEEVATFTTPQDKEKD